MPSFEKLFYRHLNKKENKESERQDKEQDEKQNKNEKEIQGEQENSKQETPQEKGLNFLKEKKTYFLDRMKYILNVVKPHTMEDAMYKLAGAWAIYSGSKILNILFYHSESIEKVLGKHLSSSDALMIGSIGGLAVLLGTTLLTSGILESIYKIKKEKIEKESNK